MKIIQYIKNHKIIFIILLIIILVALFFIYKKYQTNKESKQIHYVISRAEKGSIISSISGTGQVSDSNQIDLKPKVSGEITYLNLKAGQVIKEGSILAKIDSRDAQKSVRDAKTSLESAQLSLDKLKKSAEGLSLTQAQNTLEQAKESKQTVENNIEKDYEDIYSAISNTFLDMPNIMTDLDNILYSKEIAKSEVSISDDENNSDTLMNTTISDDKYKLEIFQSAAEANYNTARSKYTTNFNDYKNSTRTSSKESIESLLKETIDMIKYVSQAGNSENNYLDTWSDYRNQRNLEIFSKVSTYQTDLASDISKINSHLSTLSSAQRSLQDDKNSLISSDRIITEKTQSLQDVISGTPLDIRAQEISVQQKKDALSDTYENLSNYNIKAPFDGIIGSVSIKKGDSVSSATSLATLVSGKKIAEISLNEVDIAKIKTEQKATLTFDAVSDLTITGEVVEVDQIGTVSQGVVSYNIKISFDTDDERIKPGMSVGASIITDSKQDVLVILSSAIKTKNGNKYVEIPNENIDAVNSNNSIALINAPKQVSVETGLSGDNMTEIASGLNEGDFVITKTISSSSKSTASSGSTNNSSNRSNNQFIFGSGPMGR